MSGKPTVSYWHLWTDEDGVSRQTRCSMDDFELKSIQPGADPQWQGRKTTGTMTSMVTILPVGWIGEWHENPKPQWIIPLSGRWFVAAMDGTRAEMGPGDIAFGGDQNCRTIGRKCGHKSGTIGDQAAVLMIVQLEALSRPVLPCGFR